MVIIKLWLIHQRCVLDLNDSMQKLVTKIYLFLSKKIIYADSAEMVKHFYKKFYNITL
jgi:hypothetical protein